MVYKHGLIAGLAAALLLGGLSGAEARSDAAPTTFQGVHVRNHLRVDGSSDLRGTVRARSGLNVTAGLSADSLSTTGPATVGGVLKVAGAATSDGLNAGAGAISTSGALQGGSLTLGGDATVGGSVQVARTLTAGGLSLGGGGLQAGSITTGSINARCWSMCHASDVSARASNGGESTAALSSAAEDPEATDRAHLLTRRSLP